MFKSWQSELVQDMLNTHHGARLKVNGDFDKATESAVQLFQRDTQVEPTGIVGPESWQQLRNISC
jgi:peptidoglycan hydrolase-like protein with peptidoglycan-binding domain